MKIKVKHLTQSALFAALVFAATLTGAVAPIGGGAYIHIGDALIYTAVLFLPMPFAIGAAAIGAGLADVMLGSAIYVIPTVVTKTLVVIAAKGIMRLAKTSLMQDTLISLCGIVNILGYFVAECFMTSVAGAASGILFNVLQALASAVVFIIISGPARKIYKRVTKKDDK